MKYHKLAHANGSAATDWTIFFSAVIQSMTELFSHLTVFLSSIKVNQVSWRTICLGLKCTSHGLSVLNVKQPVELEPFCSLLK